MFERFKHPFLSLATVAFFAAPALATPATFVDTTPGTAVKDGTVNPGEYFDSTVGIGAGFGNVIGSAAELHVDSDAFGSLNFGLVRGTGGLFNDVVIYLDTVPGGFATTATFDDNADGLRQAISGLGFDGTNRATLNFASGFEADYAIAFFSGFAGLWQLAGTGSHDFLADAGLAGGGDANNPFFEFSVSLADIGLSPGGTLRYVATYLNGGDGFRSNEFHGVASGPADNIGQTEYSLADGDFISFTTFEPPVDAETRSFGAVKALY